MAKNKNIDFVADMQERANHNMNPYYWFNRVTPFTVAQWRTNAYFAPIFFVIYSAVGLLWLNALNESAIQVNKTFWQFIFDFGDSSTVARFAGLLLFLVYWVITAIAAVQAVTHKFRVASSEVPPSRKKEKKKKYPKRPKNYK